MPIKDSWVLLREGLRVGARLVGRRLRRQPMPRYSGTPEEICRAVVEDCWDGTYFRAGTLNLDQFWLRDFAIALDGLLDLGHAERAWRCLEWALGRYEAAGRVTTTIFGHRHPADVYTYASDSLPFLLYCLERLDAAALHRRFAPLLRQEVARYFALVFDSAAGRPRHDRMFSATKDTMHFVGTCFTHAMCAWLSELLDRAPDLVNPFRPYPLKAGLQELYWTGEFFKNDVRSEPPLCSGDANFWPYWCQLVDRPRDKLLRSIAAVQAHGLDRPFPLKYHQRRMPSREVLVQRLFLPNYQGDSIWSFFTPQWIELVGTVAPELAARYVSQYAGWIERWGTWIEVFEPDGSRPLQGRFGYTSDCGMLWAAAMPRLLRRYGSASTPAPRLP